MYAPFVIHNGNEMLIRSITTTLPGRGGVWQGVAWWGEVRYDLMGYGMARLVFALTGVHCLWGPPRSAKSP